MVQGSDALQNASLKAVTEFTSRTTVVVVAGGDLTRGIGSGLLLKTEKGTPFLLTARHVLEDGGEWKPLRLMVPGLGGRELSDVGVRAEFAFPRQGHGAEEKPVDVALVAIKPELHELLRPLAVPLASIAEDDDIGPTDVVYLVGFPAFMAFPDAKAPNVYQLSMITFATGLKDRDKFGRLEIHWGDATAGPEVRSYPHLQIIPNQPFELSSPQGISGGGAWRLRGAQKGELWSPSSDAKLIGVPVAWNQRFTQYAESVVHWGAWLREAAQRLD